MVCAIVGQVLLETRPAAAQGITLEPIASGLARPIDIAHAGDGSGRLFIALQRGEILIYDGERVLPDPFLDIASLVLCCRERGLLGFAFHPNYVENGYLFVNYTNKSGNTVIARYQVSSDDNVVDPASATELLTVTQPYSNHNGGQLRFGPDGYLYIALGDGGDGGDPQNFAQNLESLLGKMLRIDVDGETPYAVPPDNPTFDNVRSEIWALGLRNPWRFSFDRKTGDLFIADVGQQQREEVSFQPAGSKGGENYGWRCFEGRLIYSPSTKCDKGKLTEPILDYAHSSGNCSVTGGYRYRGAPVSAFVGDYFFADFCTGRIWAATEQDDGSWLSREVMDTNYRFSTFGEDETGELYIAHLNDSNGIVFRLVFDKIGVGNLGIDETWTGASFDQAYQDPIVIAGPPTIHGRDPGVVRLRKVTGTGFEAKFQEWDYLNGRQCRREPALSGCGARPP